MPTPEIKPEVTQPSEVREPKVMLSRRGFLKGAGLATVATVGTLAVAACSGNFEIPDYQKSVPPKVPSSVPTHKPKSP